MGICDIENVTGFLRMSNKLEVDSSQAPDGLNVIIIGKIVVSQWIYNQL